MMYWSRSRTFWTRGLRSIICWLSVNISVLSQRHSRGVRYMHVHRPRANFFFLGGAYLQELVVSAPRRQKCVRQRRVKILGIFFCSAGEIWRVEVVNVVLFSLCFEGVHWKGRQLFWENKCTPDKILPTPMSWAAKCLKKCWVKIISNTSTIRSPTAAVPSSQDWSAAAVYN